MMIPVFGGPYNGRGIWAAHLLEFTTVLVIGSQESSRRFLYLPAVDDWLKVIDARMSIESSSQRHYYELISTRNGLELRFDPGGSAYEQALSQAIREMPDRNGEARPSGSDKP